MPNTALQDADKGQCASRLWHGSGRSSSGFWRHLDESQRAMIAAKIADLEKGQKKADGQICTSIPEAAQKLNVSSRSVKSARKVLEQGSPALVNAVEAGGVRQWTR